jgi:hypothetical protein
MKLELNCHGCFGTPSSSPKTWWDTPANRLAMCWVLLIPPTLMVVPELLTRIGIARGFALNSSR